MMIINDDEATHPRLLFRDTVRKSLCAGGPYRFSASFVNIDKERKCTPHFPKFYFSLETETGQLLQYYTSDELGYADTVRTTFTEYGFNFVMPPGQDNLVVKIMDISYDGIVGPDCGDDFAVDDITVTPLGPNVTISFEHQPPETLVSNVCFQDNKSITLTGKVDPYYANTAVQWQQSTDDGINWTDIPGATSITYTKTFSVADTFLFRLRASEASHIGNTNCSVVSNVKRVAVDGLPEIHSLEANSPVCVGDNLVFKPVLAATYEWHGPNGFYDNSPFAHIPKITFADSGMYYVEAKTLGGCKVTDSTHVIVIGPHLVVGPDHSICKGELVKLHAEGGDSYSWTPTTDISGIHRAEPLVSPPVSTNYTVKISDQTGCIAEGEIVVKVINTIAVNASFGGEGYLCPPLDSALFTDKSAGKIIEWHWDFGNGNASSDSTPTFQKYIITPGSAPIPITLSVTDTAGCSATTRQYLKVAANCYIAVPNAFTPNGDGLNDELSPLNAYKATNLLFRVYNRFGYLLFETRDWTRKWNGTFRNENQPMDTYIWTLEYNDATKKKIVQRGTTVLIR